MTQYMFLIHADEAGYADVTPEQWAAMTTQHDAFAREVVASGATVVSGEALLPSSTATTVRGDGAGGHVVTDGPFAETKEALGGFYIIDAPDLDAALALARHCPAHGGGIEVRPVMERAAG